MSSPSCRSTTCPSPRRLNAGSEGGITLHYGRGARAHRREPGKRQRLLDAHRVARRVLPAAESPRSPRDARSSPSAASPRRCARISGSAPASWDSLTRHHALKNFTDQEIQISGLGSASHVRPFPWAPRSRSAIIGATVGFGARRLDDGDRSRPSTSTPRTPIYKSRSCCTDWTWQKTIDGAQGRHRRGATDVMAAHVAGWRERRGHVWHRLWLRRQDRCRLLGDRGSGRWRAPGRALGGLHLRRRQRRAKKAAARRRGPGLHGPDARGGGPGGQDLRPASIPGRSGDRRPGELGIPLFEFAIAPSCRRWTCAAPRARAGPRLIRHRRAHQGSRPARQYTRQLAGWLGMDIPTVEQAIRGWPRRGHLARGAGRDRDGEAVASPATPGARPRGSVSHIERQALEAVLQHPLLRRGVGLRELDGQSFTVPAPHSTMRPRDRRSRRLHRR